MKPVYSLALAAVLSLSLLTACGPAVPSGSASSGSADSSSVSSSLPEPDTPDLSEEEPAPSSGVLKPGKFKNIQLSALSPSIRIERGEDWAVRYTLHSKEQISRAEVSGDTLYFSSAFTPAPSSELKDCELVIIIPVGAELGDVELSTAAGSIELFNLTCDKLELESVSGRIQLDHIVSKKLEAESISGCITASSCTADRAELESTSGSVCLDGTFQKADLSTTSGTCELYAQIDQEAHMETVSGAVIAQSPVKHLDIQTLGPVLVDSRKYSDKQVVIGEGTPSLCIESVSGKVTVDQNALIMIQ